MATILEQYLQLKSATGEQMASGTLPCDKVFTYQEILYRISVLESCQAFCKTAPITTDTKVSVDQLIIADSKYPELIYLREISEKLQSYPLSTRILACEMIRDMLEVLDRAQFDNSHLK